VIGWQDDGLRQSLPVSGVIRCLHAAEFVTSREVAREEQPQKQKTPASQTGVSILFVVSMRRASRAANGAEFARGDHG
jgi:hypothetical protein